MCSSRSVSEPNLQPESGTFLQRAMSQGNAVFSSLWIPASIDIDCSPDFKLVDPTTSSDLDDAIHEEVQVYTQISSAAQVGYLFAEYDCSFEEPIYTPHSTALPIFTGPGQRTSFSVAASPVVGNAFTLYDTAGVAFANALDGTIFRCVFDLQTSVAPAGTTFANLATVHTYYHSTTTTTTNASDPLPLVGGMTLYVVNTSSNAAVVYTSMEAAINGNGSGQLMYATLGTDLGLLKFDIALVRVGVASLPTVQ